MTLHRLFTHVLPPPPGPIHPAAPCGSLALTDAADAPFPSQSGGRDRGQRDDAVDGRRRAHRGPDRREQAGYNDVILSNNDVILSNIDFLASANAVTAVPHRVVYMLLDASCCSMLRADRRTHCRLWWVQTGASGPGKIPAQTATSRDVYLPAGLFYVYNSSKTIKSTGGTVSVTLTWA